jgi:hypothetical protein
MQPIGNLEPILGKKKKTVHRVLWYSGGECFQNETNLINLGATRIVALVGPKLGSGETSKCVRPFE